MDTKQTVQSFVQKRVGLRFSFEVGENGLTCTMRDSSGERGATFAYEALDPTVLGHLTLKRTPLFIRLCGLWAISYLMIPLFVTASDSAGVIWAIVATGFSFLVIVARLSHRLDIKFDLLHVQPGTPGSWGPIRIIADETGREIVQAVTAAWRSKLNRLYGRANLNADPNAEATRLKWLRDRGILSEQEFCAELAQIGTANEPATPPLQSKIH